MIRCLCFVTHAQDGLQVSLSGANGTEPVQLVTAPLVNKISFIRFWDILTDRYTLTDEATIYVPERLDENIYRISYDTSNFNYLVPLFTLIDGWLRFYNAQGLELRELY